MLARTAGLSHMTEFIAGAKRTGTRVAMIIVERKSSARPLATLPRMLAVAGATTVRCARSARETWPISEPLKSSNMSWVTGLPVTVWKVRGVTKFMAFFVITTWTFAPRLTSSRAR